MTVIVFKALIFSVSFIDSSFGIGILRFIFSHNKEYVSGKLQQSAEAKNGYSQGFGFKIANREIWNSLASQARFKSVISEADKIISTPKPVWSEEVYLGYLNSGESLECKEQQSRIIRIVSTVTWAACLTNNEKYIAYLDSYIPIILKQKSWTFPQDDLKLRNFRGTDYSVDLSAANYAHTLAQLVFLVGEKLSGDLKNNIFQEVNKRVFLPVKKMESTNNYSWLQKKNNWNAVCLSGVVGAASILCAEKQDKDYFLELGKSHIKNYLSGFLKDGYCTEGVDYYNYGFRHFIFLRETILKNSFQKEDIFKVFNADKIATYLQRIEITNGYYPSISDSPNNPRPSNFIVRYLSNQFKTSVVSQTNTYSSKFSHNLIESMLSLEKGFLNKSFRGKKTRYAIRSEFPEAGILIGRPNSKSKEGMGVLFKGGNNGENHNHNDLSEYIIVVGGEALVVDPGKMKYIPGVFNAKRYTFPVMSSYGHSVPLVAGTEQKNGEDAKAVVIQKVLTKSKDKVTYDLKKAYPVNSLVELTRDCVYERLKSKVVVTDNYSFKSQEDFETAIITRGDVEIKNDTSVIITGTRSKIKVKIYCDEPVEVNMSQVNENIVLPFTRIAIKLKNKTQKGNVKLEYTSF